MITTTTMTTTTSSCELTHLYERVANLGQTPHRLVLAPSCVSVPPHTTSEMRHRSGDAALCWMAVADDGERRHRQLSRDAARDE